MQGKTSQWRAGAVGNAHHMLGVRYGDDRSVQADTGPAGAVPGVFSEAAKAGADASGEGAERRRRVSMRG